MASHDQSVDSPEVPARVGPMLAMAVLLGVGGALVASLFVWVETSLQHLVWTSVPEALGIGTSAWWYVLLALLVGALVVMAARRLPGATGGSPLAGFHFDTGPGTIASVAIAALGTLVFGFVLGPEAPLIACGTALGGWVMRGRDARSVQLGMLLGGVAAIGAIFGNPLITGFMILEFAAMGAMPAAALLAVLVALGAGYVVQVGLGPWSGLGTHALSLGALPAYPGLTGVEFIGAAVVAVIASALAIGVREFGEQVDRFARGRPDALLALAALVTAGVAAAAVALTGQGFGVVLFSGQEALPTIIGLTSVGSLAVIGVAKALAYAMALGGGLRGGPIFPAVTLGVLVGVIASLLVPGLTLPGMVVVGIAATTAAMTKLPFTATMLAVLLTVSVGGAVTPLAIVGSVVGFLARLALDRRDERLVQTG